MFSKPMIITICLLMAANCVSCRAVDTHQQRLANKGTDPMYLALYGMLALVCSFLLVLFILCLLYYFYKYCIKKKKTGVKRSTKKGSPSAPKPLPKLESTPPEPQQQEQPPAQPPEESPSKRQYSSFKAKIEKLLHKNRTQEDTEQKEKQGKARSPPKAGKHKSEETDETERSAKRKEKAKIKSPKVSPKKRPKKKDSEEHQGYKEQSTMSRRVQQISEQLKDEKPNEQTRKKWLQNRNKPKTPPPSSYQQTDEQAKSSVGPQNTRYSNVDARAQKLMALIKKDDSV